jgi:hypothetical protein
MGLKIWKYLCPFGFCFFVFIMSVNEQMCGLLTPLSFHNSFNFNHNLTISMNNLKETKLDPKFL